MQKLIDAHELWAQIYVLSVKHRWRDRTNIAFNKCLDTIQFFPPVDAVEVVRCKDCKYFRDNKVYNIQGFPIMGNFVCDKWANGCRTDEDGYCFLGERREDAKTN